MAPGELAEPFTLSLSRNSQRSPAGRNLTRSCDCHKGEKLRHPRAPVQETQGHQPGDSSARARHLGLGDSKPAVGVPSSHADVTQAVAPSSKRRAACFLVPGLSRKVGPRTSFSASLDFEARPPCFKSPNAEFRCPRAKMGNPPPKFWSPRAEFRSRSPDFKTHFFKELRLIAACPAPKMWPQQSDAAWGTEV